MQLNELLSADTTALLAKPIESKKRLLEIISQHLQTHVPDLESKELFEMLLARERLGSTGLGHGIAIPHARIESIQQPCAALVLLKEGIDFDAHDGQPVDLICGLLVPASEPDDHIKTLSHLAKLFSTADVQSGLRACTDTRSLYQLALKYSSEFG